MESSTLHITMLAYVYVAGRLLHPDAPTWPDMEYLLNIQGSNQTLNPKGTGSRHHISVLNYDKLLCCFNLDLFCVFDRSRRPRIV